MSRSLCHIYTHITSERGIRAVRYPSVDPDPATRELQDQQTKDAYNTHVYITPEYVIETDDGILLHLNKHIILAVMDEADLYSKWYFEPFFLVSINIITVFIGVTVSGFPSVKCRSSRARSFVNP